MVFLKLVLPKTTADSTTPGVTTTSGPPTTADPTTTAPPAEPKVELVFKIQQNFTEDLGNKSSSAFVDLANKVSEAVSSLL